jgi:hypothetical protein
MEKAAHQVFSSKETIARSVAPLVAVTASEEAEQLCRINHISSVADLLKPFGDLMEGRGKLPQHSLLIQADIGRS